MTEPLRFAREYSLQNLNTFGLPAIAEYYTEVHSADQLPALEAWLQAHPMPVLLLGGGSNLVLGERVPGLVPLPWKFLRKAEAQALTGEC